MTALLLWAIGGDLPVRVLAVIGGAAAGAALTSWTARLLCRVLFRQNLPRIPAWSLRGLGALLFGWLVALWVFGGGGGGLGGAGGLGLGPGPGKGGSEGEKIVENGDRDKRARVREDLPPPAESETLRIEVLGNEPLQRIAGNDFDPNRRYRVVGEKTLLSLEEVQQRVRRRRTRSPSLRRVEILLYRDSPARNKQQVAALESWLQDLEEVQAQRWIVAFPDPGRDAPVH